MSKRRTSAARSSSKPQDAGSDNRAQFNVDQVVVDKNRTTFYLNSSKEGFSQIVFDFNDRADLKGLLFGIFEAGKPFDFQISEKLAKPMCKINGIRRPFSGLADEEEHVANRDYKNYRVFFKAQRAYQALFYFQIEKPAQSDRIAWVWAPRGSQMDALMAQAFGQGRPIRVWVGVPVKDPSFDNELVARVYKCQIEFDGG